MMEIQKVVTVRYYDGEYYNFFFTPGSIGSLAKHIREGWQIVFIKDDAESKQAVAVFKKPITSPKQGMANE